MRENEPKHKIVILIVDDNSEDLMLIRNYLGPKGYSLFEAQIGKDAVNLFKMHKPHVVILDYLLPDMLGAEVCQLMKSIYPEIPVVILTNVSDISRKVEAFQMGCNDYMIKPCELEELEIRIQNLLKRTPKEKEVILRVGDIEIDKASRKVTKQGNAVDLTVKEYVLLEYLAQNKGKILTRTMILEQVWGEDSGTFTNIVDVYINYLRKKLDPPSENSYIKTVRGIGYVIDELHPTAKAA